MVQAKTKCIGQGCSAEIDYEPEYCCNGRECGCFGKPIEQPLCDACWDKVLGKTTVSEE